MGLFRYWTTPIALALWLVCVWMLRQDVVSQSFLAKDAYIDITDGALIMRQDYLGLYLGGQKVGFKQFVLKEDGKAPGSAGSSGQYYLFESSSYMRVVALGMPIEMKMKQEGEINKDLTLRSFRFQYNASGQETYLLGTVEGNQLELVSKSEGYSSNKTLPLNTPVYHSDSIHLLLAQDGLEVGKTKTYPIFEPMLSSFGNVVAKVEKRDTVQLPSGESVGAFLVDIEFKGLHTRVWIDKTGNVYKEVSSVAGMTFTAMRETREQASDMTFLSEGVEGRGLDSPGAVVDLANAAKVVPNRPLPNPGAVELMRFELSGAGRDQLVFDGHFQSLLGQTDDGLVIQTRRMDYERVASAIGSGPPYVLPDPSLKEYLDDDLNVQSSHPAIRAKAMEVAGNARNPWQAGESIAEWLYNNMTKEIRGTIPSALEILNTMKGDCNEHSTLFAAMARSIGIPTKIIAGLVYQDDAFYYHAWNEIYVNGLWWPLDSTLNRIRMDAAHVKMAEGALDQQANIVNLIGNVSIEIRELR